jgi:hypothetical protein
MMFDPNKIRELEDIIESCKNDINTIAKQAKFIVDGESNWYWEMSKDGHADWAQDDWDNLEVFKYDSDKVYISHYTRWESHYPLIHSDSLLDAILTCYSEEYHPTEINNVKFKEYYFTFLITHHETILNHPESDKLIMLLESLQHESIELLKTLIGVED